MPSSAIAKAAVEYPFGSPSVIAKSGTTFTLFHITESPLVSHSPILTTVLKDV
ncbi:MAG: hypothetical protein ACOCG3_03805 [Rikenellaceae bacterium MAG02]